MALHAPIHETIYRGSTLKNELIDIVQIADGAVVVHFWSRLVAGLAHPAGPHEVDTLILAVVTEQNDTWCIRALENVTLTDPRTGQAILRGIWHSCMDSLGVRRRRKYAFEAATHSVSSIYSRSMSWYAESRLFRIGLWLFALGCGPWLAVIVLSGIGLWPDPDPNPIGPGLLAFFSFWPSVICMGIGAVQAGGVLEAATRLTVPSIPDYKTSRPNPRYWGQRGYVFEPDIPSSPSSALSCSRAQPTISRRPTLSIEPFRGGSAEDQ